MDLKFSKKMPHISFAKHPRPVAGWNPRNRKVYAGGNYPKHVRNALKPFVRHAT